MVIAAVKIAPASSPRGVAPFSSTQRMCVTGSSPVAHFGASSGSLTPPKSPPSAVNRSTGMDAGSTRAARPGASSSATATTTGTILNAQLSRLNAQLSGLDAQRAKDGVRVAEIGKDDVGARDAQVVDTVAAGRHAERSRAREFRACDVERRI